MNLRSRAWSLAAGAVLLTSTLCAQSERGSLSGTVTDSSSAVVQGARVLVTAGDTNTAFNALTGATGEFNVPNLQVGPYTVRVDKEGFKPSLLTGVSVNAGINSHFDIQLEVGAAQQVVEVQAQSAALQTEDAKAATTITNKLVDELPTGGGRRAAQSVQPGDADAGSQKFRR